MRQAWSDEARSGRVSLGGVRRGRVRLGRQVEARLGAFWSGWSWSGRREKEKTMVYKYAVNGIFPISAQTAGEELEKIERKHGEVTKELVLESARSAKSVLHPCFEWNDTKAAEKFRLTQATRLINAVTIVVDEAEVTEVRAFVNVTDSNKGRFINVQSALTDEDAREIVLRRALNELQAFKKKYADLSELAVVFAAIAQIVA